MEVDPDVNRFQVALDPEAHPFLEELAPLDDHPHLEPEVVLHQLVELGQEANLLRIQEELDLLVLMEEGDLVVGSVDPDPVVGQVLVDPDPVVCLVLEEPGHLLELNQREIEKILNRKKLHYSKS